MMRRRTGIVLLLPLLILGLSATAQRDDNAPQKMDTTVADTVVVGSEASPGAAAIDSISSLAGNQETTTAGPDSIVLRSVPDSVVSRWKNNPHFAYANDPDYWRRRPEANGKPGSSIFLSKWLSPLIYCLLGGVLLFAIVRIISENNLGLFYRSKRARNTGAAGESDAPEEEDLDARLQYFLDRNDHRQAVRYLYLLSLRKLGDRELIRRGRETTNQEYLRQLRGTPQENAFRFLTGAYEKVWYGEFPLSDASFRQLLDHFTDFDKTLPS